MSVPLFSASHVAKWDRLTTEDCPPLPPRGGGEAACSSSTKTLVPSSGRLRNVESHSRRPCCIRAATPDTEDESEDARPNSEASHDGFDFMRRRSDEAMVVKTHAWITLWFLVTAPIILWDASYCFTRPRSMAGGDLHWIWKPYEIYQEIDHVYGVESLERNDGFPSAQSFLNVIETLLNLTYLYLAHLSCAPAAPLIGFMSVVMTLSKTVLYWAQEYYCGWCATGHNDWTAWLVYWALPNGFWIVVPALITYTLGKDITAALVHADRKAIRHIKKN